MRMLTNKEKKQIAGGIFRVIPLPEGQEILSFAFSITGDTEHIFLGYKHFASKVTDGNGNLVFQGNYGEFTGGDSARCVVFPCSAELGSAAYFYYK